MRRHVHGVTELDIHVALDFPAPVESTNSFVGLVTTE